MLCLKEGRKPHKGWQNTPELGVVNGQRWFSNIVLNWVQNPGRLRFMFWIPGFKLLLYDSLVAGGSAAGHRLGALGGLLVRVTVNGPTNLAKVWKISCGGRFGISTPRGGGD